MPTAPTLPARSVGKGCHLPSTSLHSPVWKFPELCAFRGGRIDHYERGAETVELLTLLGVSGDQFPSGSPLTVLIVTEGTLVTQDIPKDLGTPCQEPGLKTIY